MRRFSKISFVSHSMEISFASLRYKEAAPTMLQSLSQGSLAERGTRLGSTPRQKTQNVSTNL